MRTQFLIKRLAALLCLYSLPVFCQSNHGVLQLKITDPSGQGVKATVNIQSEANAYRNALTTSNEGTLQVQRLPYGIYHLQVEQPGFAVYSDIVAIRSQFPTEEVIRLQLPTVNESVAVSAVDTLIDPDQAGSVSQIGDDQIQHRLSSIPGRSLQDLVNSQPGWLYEGNAVLHPGVRNIRPNS